MGKLDEGELNPWLGSINQKNRERMIDKKFGHRYQKIHSKLWEDEKMIALSSMAQLTYAYLLSNRHTNIIGFYQVAVPPGEMILNMKDVLVLDKYIGEIQESGMVKYDKKNSLLLINNFLKYNPISKNFQILAAAEHRLLDLPRSELFYDFLSIIENPVISQLGDNSKLIPIVRKILGTLCIEEPEPEENLPAPTETNPELDQITWVATRWNEIVGTSLPCVSKITDERRATIKARLDEYGPEKIEEVFRLISKNPFMLGENDRGWKADFDFSLRKNRFTKILEGSYQGSAGKKDVYKRSKDAIKKVAEEWGFERNQLGGNDGPEDIPPGPSDDQFAF